MFFLVMFLLPTFGIVAKISGRNLMGLDLITVCLLFLIKTIVIHGYRECGLYRALPFIYVLSKNSNSWLFFTGWEEKAKPLDVIKW